MEIKDIEQSLKSVFQVSFEKADSKIPVDRLNLYLPGKARDDLLLEMMYVPGIEAQVENSRLLQFFVYLADGEEFNEEVKAKLRELLHRININMVGSFGYHEEDSFIYYKYVLMIPKKTSDLSANIIIDAVWLTAYLVDNFYPHIEALISQNDPDTSAVKGD